MTFRIFQVNADGVASPVYDRNGPETPRPTSTAGSAAPAGAAPAGDTSAEWDELRERLRQQANPKRARKSLFGL